MPLSRQNKLIIMNDCNSCINYDEDWGGSCKLGNIEFQHLGEGCGDYREDEEDEDCGPLDDDLGIDQDEPNY